MDKWFFSKSLDRSSTTSLLWRKYSFYNTEMENNLKSIVYLTINLVNKKIYIGVHQTKTPYTFDNYYGCGVSGSKSYHFLHPKTRFQYALKKYGLKNFIRITLFVFDKYEDALLKERELVNEEFLKRPDVYNTAIGGNGMVFNRQIKVYCYDSNGLYMEEFDSYTKAGNKYDVNSSSIAYAVKYGSLTANRFWSLEKVDCLNLENFHISNNKEVFLYDSNGTFIKSFNSINEAAQYLDVNSANIQRAIKHQTKVKNHYVLPSFKEKYIPKEYKRKRGEIYQYTLDGKFIRKWESQKEASDTLGINSGRISDALRNNTAYKDSQWKFEYSEYIDPIEIKVIKKPVLQYDLDGNLIKEWDSYTECRRKFPNVGHCLKGKIKTCKGYKFIYKN